MLYAYTKDEAESINATNMKLFHSATLLLIYPYNLLTVSYLFIKHPKSFKWTTISLFLWMMIIMLWLVISEIITYQVMYYWMLVSHCKVRLLCIFFLILHYTVNGITMICLVCECTALLFNVTIPTMYLRVQAFLPDNSCLEVWDLIASFAGEIK